MNAGELRHLITLQEPGEKSTDDEGNEVHTPVKVCDVMAAIKDVSGRDFYEAAAHQMENVVTFTIRWRDGLRNDMQIIYGGTVYDIVQINHLGYRRDWTQIKARIRQPQGSEGSAHGYL